MFNVYINTFFLWDYVDKTFEVIPLFSNKFVKSTIMESVDQHSRQAFKIEARLPSENEIPIFLENVNWAIRRREILTVAMLKIAISDMPKEKSNKDN